MEIYQLRTFVAVAQQGHLTKAAALLHLSQPAVTAQIKALEEELGMPLFERTASGVCLTRLGENLLPQAQALLSATRNMVFYAQSLKDELTGTLKIGMDVDPAITKAGQWCQALTHKHPLLELQLCLNMESQLLNQIRKKELDAAFFLGFANFASLKERLLGTLSYCVAIPIAWEDKALADVPWIGINTCSYLATIEARIHKQAGCSPKRILQSANLAITTELVAAGIGAALLPEAIALQLEGNGKVLRVPETRTLVPLQFIYSIDREGEPRLNALLQAMHNSWPMLLGGYAQPALSP